MAYSTGSGTRDQMMAAVLAHAVGDGWSTTSGDWPIFKGNVRGVDFSYNPFSFTEYTIGTVQTVRNIDQLLIAVGSSPTAASVAAGNPNLSAKAGYIAPQISEWHIFSDPTLCDYISVAYRQSSSISADNWAHFSFGEIDKGGMTYGSVAFAAAVNMMPFNDVSSGNSAIYREALSCSLSHASLLGDGKIGCHISRADPYTSFCLHSSNSPIPSTGWFNADVTYGRGDWLYYLLCGGYRGDVVDPYAEHSGGTETSISHIGWYNPQAFPFNAGLTASAIPFVVANRNDESRDTRAIWLGTYPNIRKINLLNHSAGDEIEYGSEVWKIFPVLRLRDNETIGDRFEVSSGTLGYAYKKVT